MEHVTGASYYAEQVEPDQGGVVGWLTESRVTGLEILTCTLQLFTRDLTVAQSNEVDRDEVLGPIGCRRPAPAQGGKVGELGCSPCAYCIKPNPYLNENRYVLCFWKISALLDYFSQ